MATAKTFFGFSGVGDQREMQPQAVDRGEKRPDNKNAVLVIRGLRKRTPLKFLQWL